MVSFRNTWVIINIQHRAVKALYNMSKELYRFYCVVLWIGSARGLGQNVKSMLIWILIWKFLSNPGPRLILLISFTVMSLALIGTIMLLPKCQWSNPGPLVPIWINFNPAWMNNYFYDKVWDEITYTSTNSNGQIVEIWEWPSNFIPHYWVCYYLSTLG